MAVESSTGIGLPSAVEGTRLAEEVLDWKSGGKEKGREWRWDLDTVGGEVAADVIEGDERWT